MTSTIRIHVGQAKAGDVRVQGTRSFRITNKTEQVDGIELEYADGNKGTTFHPYTSSNPTITIELPETHPIAVLERKRSRVAEQWAAAHLEFLEAAREGDTERQQRRELDKALLRGKEWGLNQAVQELRAGIEFYPGKDS